MLFNKNEQLRILYVGCTINQYKNNTNNNNFVRITLLGYSTIQIVFLLFSQAYK